MRKGQGLLETTIAMAVLVTGVVAVMSLAYSNASSTRKSTERIIAANLAREGLEVVHYKRDSNWMQGLAFDNGMFSGTDYTFALIFDSFSGAWTFDFSPDAISHDDTKAYRKGGLYLQTSGSGSVPAGGEETNFRRLVTANLICRRASDGATEIRVSGQVCSGGYSKIGRQIIAAVEWVETGKTQSFNIEDRIYDWR